MPHHEQPWVIVAPSFLVGGEQEQANRALAEYLLDHGTPVHLVYERGNIDLSLGKKARAHTVTPSKHSPIVGEVLLDRKARYTIDSLRRRFPAAVLVANGPTCLTGDINLCHFVHHAWQPVPLEVPLWRQATTMLDRRAELRRERMAYRECRLVIANSEMTRRDLQEYLEGSTASTRTIYPGADASWMPVTPIERFASRNALGIAQGQMLALFAGELNYDDRQGFDILFSTWSELCTDPTWDVDLLVHASGPAWESWRQRIEDAGLEGRIRLLAPATDYRLALVASDLLVIPARYEPYGLILQEALCRGLAVMTTSRAGIAERFTHTMQPLIVDDPAGWVNRLKLWRADPQRWRLACGELGHELRGHTWEQMAREVVDLVETALPIEAGMRLSTQP